MKLVLILIGCISHIQASVSSHKYQIQVRPQLNNIIEDYYQILPHLESVSTDSAKYFRELLKNEEIYSELSACAKNFHSSACQNNFLFLSEKISLLQEQAQKTHVEWNLSNEVYLGPMFSLIYFKYYLLAIEDLYQELRYIHFLSLAKPNFKSWDPSSLIKIIYQAQSYLLVSKIESIPFELRHDFKQFYTQFIIPLEKSLKTTNAHIYFDRNQKDLNFQLHLWNQNLTKRSKKIPDRVKSYLATIHQRWNGILKAIY